MTLLKRQLQSASPTISTQKQSSPIGDKFDGKSPHL